MCWIWTLFWQIGPFYIVYNPHWNFYAQLYHYQRSMLDLGYACDQYLTFRKLATAQNVLNLDLFLTDWTFLTSYILDLLCPFVPLSEVHAGPFLSVQPIFQILKTHAGAKLCWIWTFFYIVNNPHWTFYAHLYHYQRSMYDLFCANNQSLRSKPCDGATMCWIWTFSDRLDLFFLHRKLSTLDLICTFVPLSEVQVEPFFVHVTNR